MHRMVRRIFKLVAFLFGFILFTALAAVGAFLYCNGPPAFSPDLIKDQDGISLDSESTGENFFVRLELRRGESAQSVGQRLEAAGLIRSRYFWYLLCRYDAEPIKNGAYLIEVPASQIAIHRILVSGKQILQRVTVPEGLTVRKIAKLMEEAGICPADEFLAAASDSSLTELYQIPGSGMEGYLYPDTYLFPPAYPAARVIQTMADTFFSRINSIDERVASMTPDELNQLVILASIIEREYRLDEEAPIMAGVFLNRMNIRMALQSCATVEYVITEIQGRPHPDILLTRDIEIRDPYNTYIRPGLPPGPICSPGSTALKAVFSPIKSNYLYFRLADTDSGKHYFSQTLDDHIKAGRLYLKGTSR